MVRVNRSTSQAFPKGSTSGVPKQRDKKAYTQLKKFKLWSDRMVKYDMLNNIEFWFTMKYISLEHAGCMTKPVHIYVMK